MAWKSIILAFVFAIPAAIIAAEGEASVGLDEYGTPNPWGFLKQTNLQEELSRQLWLKIVTSSGNVGNAVNAMVKNFAYSISKLTDQLATNYMDYYPHIKEFIEAIPAEAIHKMTTDSLQTALKQTREQCINVAFTYNPIHPGLSVENYREKRETETMTLAKLGQAIATLFTDVDRLVVEYIRRYAPRGCKLINQLLEEQIAKAEAMNPEDLKKKILGL